MINISLFSFIDPVVIACFASLSLTFSIFILGSSKISPSLKLSKVGKNEKKKILFITAHPDDECMFFGPSILHFTENRLETSSVYLLCLSNGNCDGKGVERTKELWSSCEILGIPTENIMLYKCDDMPDDPTTIWPTYHTSKIISDSIHWFDINAVITFDSHGVSNHINHCSVNNALEHLIEENQLPLNCEAYCLNSVNILRKYSSIIDVCFSYIFSPTVFTLNVRQVYTIQKAMRSHASQYVWFRKLYILFSRYVLINTLTKMN